MSPNKHRPVAIRPPGLRRAVAFIHDNADIEIGLREIATAVGLSPRAVQYMFRQHLCVTPLEYLRQVRMEHAHRELQAADPALTTVNAIAVRWGFAHAGRFSVAYKQTFGIEPSATLRNPPGQDSQAMPSPSRSSLEA